MKNNYEPNYEPNDGLDALDQGVSKVFSFITPQFSVIAGLILMAIVCVALVSCAASPEDIRAEADRINMQIDDAQADANKKIDEQQEVAEAIKESAEAIKENLKESVDDVADNIKESIDEVAK